VDIDIHPVSYIFHFSPKNNIYDHPFYLTVAMKYNESSRYLLFLFLIFIIMEREDESSYHGNFLALVRTQNASRTAEQLNVAQSTVSKRMKLFEGEIGSEPPPDRICYQIKHRYPRASTAASIMVLDGYLKSLLGEADPDPVRR
jgi:hypothetical protein